VGDYMPRYRPGEKLTRALTATVTGGQMVTVGGAVAGANAADWLGVASRDGVNGDRIVVHTEGVQSLTGSGAISAGATVKCAANGQVTTWVSGTDAADLIVGKALSACSGAGSQLDVKMTR
jgi:hypothetical protein